MSRDMRSRKNAGADANDPESTGAEVADAEDEPARPWMRFARQWRIVAMSCAALVTLLMAGHVVLVSRKVPEKVAVMITRTTQRLQSSMPIPSQTTTRPAEWRRHPVQQDASLPPGPEHPGQEPQVTQVGNTTVVRCTTTTGPIKIHVHTYWAPHGAERFLDMVRGDFFSSKVALFRSVRGFICQTGVAGDPVVHQAWQQKGTILDDVQWLDKLDDLRMKRGYLSFAGGGRDSRNSEFFFTYRDIDLGTSPWEVPFGTLVGAESFEAMDHWYTGYGDMSAFGGNAPDQNRMYQHGLEYLEKGFPEIDYITSCNIAHGELVE
mmetsp:Transcript_31755/g.105197  ORF Transcript_31755/g.105197 Transcript_31755/m.105197 type:complete len:321 (+) Transcript_31755:73-1035(+)